MDINRVPSGVFSSIIAEVANQGKNTSGLSNSCREFLEAFKFPTFEILVVMQVVLPVFYSFIVPCMVGFFVEIWYHNSDNESSEKTRKKTSSILIETWAHWYFHWEICSWVWIVLAVTYLSSCPLNSRYYEFTVGMSIVSVTVSSMSNLLSDYRINLPRDGWPRRIFNISTFTMTSWTLRIIYPCIFDLYNLESATGNQDIEMASVVTSPPPPYNEALDNVNEEPPTYTETITRIRKQLPKLSRSISVSAQKLGRQMSVKQPTAVADDSHENSGNGNGISHLQDGFDGDSTSIKKVPNKPQRPPVNQSVSMIADDRIEILR